MILCFPCLFFLSLSATDSLSMAQLLSQDIAGLEIQPREDGYVFWGELHRAEDVQLIHEISARSNGIFSNETTLSVNLRQQVEEAVRQHFDQNNTRLSLEWRGRQLNIKANSINPPLRSKIQKIYPLIHFQEPASRGLPAPASRRIFLELAFVEIQSSHLRELGLRFGTPIEFSTSIRGSQISAPHKILQLQSFNPVGSFLDAALKKGYAKVHLKQSLVTENNKSASFRVGGEINFRMISKSSASVGKIDYGILLTFKPRLAGSERVFIDVEASIREPTASQIDGLPGISLRDLQTQVEAPLGRSIALAGFLVDRSYRNDDSLPGLGSLPGIGRLFTSRSIQQNRSEAYLFVTPKVLEEEG